MKAFSAKCVTKEEGYSFGRLMSRLGLRWANGELFSANNTKWRDYCELTHYNVNIQLSGNKCVTYGCMDRSIAYPIIPSEKLDSINNWEDVERIISEI